MVVWFTGMSGAGKTTLCEELIKKIKCVHIDDDRINQILVTAGVVTAPIDNISVTIDDYIREVQAIALLAKDFSDQGNLVLVSNIAPFKVMRSAIDLICKPQWITVSKSKSQRDFEDFYIDPIYPFINHDILNISQSTKIALEIIRKKYARFKKITINI